MYTHTHKLSDYPASLLVHASANQCLSNGGVAGAGARRQKPWFRPEGIWALLEGSPSPCHAALFFTECVNTKPWIKQQLHGKVEGKEGGRVLQAISSGREPVLSTVMANFRFEKQSLLNPQPFLPGRGKNKNKKFAK